MKQEDTNNGISKAA
uniref:Uncharacterized protein n=1 Tax=Rhizophora mucronata TaxID=61149 RepID=A0A2P2NVM9_RHIMU